MTEEKSIGILLQAIPYLGQGRILKVFTKDFGLITLFTKKKNLGSLTSPFCIGEWVYKKGLSDLYTLKDASLIDPLLPLRSSFAHLSCAGQIAQEILKSQLSSQKAEALYELLSCYFKQIHYFENPQVLSMSFRLKLLLHEGLLSIQSQCSRCEEMANHLSEGESFCLIHAKVNSVAFSKEEWDQLELMTFAQKFSLLQKVEVDTALIEKMGLIG
jgi:DNA repair protein RecO (recombination protein O)